MKKYSVLQKKTKFAKIFVKAKNKKEAERKAYEGDFDYDTDVIESEFLLPSTEWETVDINEISED